MLVEEAVNSNSIYARLFMDDLLKSTAEKWNINFNEETVRSFERYYELLISWNQKFNLTAITDHRDVVIKHFLDSISVSSVIDLGEISTVIDVGTGAGFPGIPMKLAFPHLSVTLLDSLGKRVTFLNEVIRELELENICAIHGRAENVSREKNMRESFDLCVSRAVAPLSSLTELCTPFVRVGGSFISYKSGDCGQEIKDAENAISVLGCDLDRVEKYMLFENSRSFVIIDKIRPVIDKYPRREGIPVKKPL